MEGREDVKSMLPFLPLVLRSSTLSWPSAAAEEALEALSRGPEHSHVDSGEVMGVAVADIKHSLGLSSEPLAPFAVEGYALFFDELLPRNDSDKWYKEVLPFLARLLLQLPSLLETHWRKADSFFDVKRCRAMTGLRLLEQQEPGVVVLSQELIAALVACSFFSLFPTHKRGSKHLPMINFDDLFASLYKSYSEKQEHKVLSSGLIEDHFAESLKVDFANKYLGGGALNRGCVQEEILFMIYPELISGMLFLPAMAENEAVKMVGAERFSSYTGYASSFQFSGDYVDKTDVDCFGRRRTRFIAIDALCSPGKRQYELQLVLREINKAFCGFWDEPKHTKYDTLSKDNNCPSALAEDCIRDFNDNSKAPEVALDLERELKDKDVPHSEAATLSLSLDQEESIGIVTGNWGCGAFGGDPQLKSMIQWLAASQVSEWILMHKWTVGDLWNMLEEYTSQRFKEETMLGFFLWLLPSGDDDAMTLDSMDTT
ncbi:hypothetical protein CRG98_008930 [Punica granatum]|uniref:PARG catalytic Macro domain-containing protein n=1 Tax=Punica granatum TaxID=22663 RepID=A0A2I0KQD4_PUNGR|nr:hypothetical protein CRG98_008930 [Punica granatum]